MADSVDDFRLKLRRKLQRQMEKTKEKALESAWEWLSVAAYQETPDEQSLVMARAMACAYYELREAEAMIDMEPAE